MKFKLLYLIFIPLFVACGFTLDLGSKTSTDRKLYKTHTYSEKTDDIIFFYDVKKDKSKQYVSVTLKNKSHFYMSYVTVKVYFDNLVNSDFFRLGSLKNGGMKTFEVEVPLNIKKMNLEFEYQLSRQDSFMRSESYGGQSEHRFGTEDVEIKKDNVVLYLSR
jgi:hypothetical protein